MSFAHWSPIASSLLIALFVILIFRRYHHRGSTPLLLWGIGLAMFGLANVAEAYSALRWQPAVFRLWYLNGAMLNAAWLGQGTVFLLSRRPRLPRVLLALLVAGSLVGGYLMWTTPVDGTHFTVGAPLSAQYREILPAGATVRKLTPVFNIYGLVTLVGGALYSAWLLYWKEDVRQRVAGNVLIALAGLTLGLASTLVRVGGADFLYTAELLSAVSMFAGFLLATARIPAAVAVRPRWGVTS